MTLVVITKIGRRNRGFVGGLEFDTMALVKIIFCLGKPGLGFMRTKT